MLCQQYRPMVSNLARRMRAAIRDDCILDREDLMQTGFEALIRAAPEWDGEHALTSFLQRHVHWAMQKAIKESGMNPRTHGTTQPLVLDLDDPVDAADPDGLTREAVTPGRRQWEPEPRCLQSEFWCTVMGALHLGERRAVLWQYVWYAEPKPWRKSRTSLVAPDTLENNLSRYLPSAKQKLRTALAEWGW